MGHGSDQKVIVGAGGTRQHGWQSLERADLDIRDYASWRSRFDDGSLSAVLSEHVLEHLYPDQALQTAALDRSQMSFFGDLGGGPFILEVQPLSDYANINDVADILALIVYEAGFPLVWESTRAEFVSKVEQTGGTLAPTIP